MKGLCALLVVLCFCETFIAQETTKYRNPWVELVRQISCRSVTCNFQETCDLQVVCTPFGDCGQRATCLQIPFPRNSVCPDPFTNAGPPYTVECFEDAGCREPMVCCHSYAKSYCHMPSGNGNNPGNLPPPNVAVEPVPESALMAQVNTRRNGNNSTNSNTNGNRNNPAANAETSGRGSRSVMFARSDFFDPRGTRVAQRDNWENSLERRRGQQVNSLNNGRRGRVNNGRRNRINNSRRSRGSRREENEIRVGDDGLRVRQSNRGRLTVEISGEPSSGSVIDVNGVRIRGNGVPTIQRIPDENGGTIELSAEGTGGRQNDNGNGNAISELEILNNAGRPGNNGQDARPSDDLGNRRGGRPGGSQTTGTGQDGQPTDRRTDGGAPVLRVNVRGGSRDVLPFIRNADIFRGHGFYGPRRRLLGEIQLDGFGGFADRFRGPLPNI